MKAERRQVTVFFADVVGFIAFQAALVVSRARHRLHRLRFFGGGRAGGSSLPRSTLRLFVLTMWTPAHAAQVTDV